MDKASVEDSMSAQLESSPSPIMQQRDNDRYTLQLRQEDDINVEDVRDYILQLYRDSSSSTPTPSSTETASTVASSSRQRSSDTKPTTHGTSYPSLGYNGKDRNIVREYASSEEATHGSGSEAERGRNQTRERARQHDTRAIGSQFDDGQKLKGPATPIMPRPRRVKKPEVQLHQYRQRIASESETDNPATTQVARRRRGENLVVALQRQQQQQQQQHRAHYSSAAAKSPCKSRAPPTHALSPLAAEMSPAPQAKSHRRINEPHPAHSGNGSQAGFIICTTTFVLVIVAILAMLMARHPLQEALLAGLLLCLLGILATKFHEFR